VASTPTSPLAPVRRVNLWQTFIALALLVLAAAWLFTGGLPILGGLSPVVRWGVLIVLMLSLLVVIGYSTNGQVLGALIDSTNHMSLSKLQITAWTVLVLSAYLIIAMPRLLASVIHPNMQPLQITFPPELILAMGISAASFAGSSLIQQNKKKKPVNLQTRAASFDDAQKKLQDAHEKLQGADSASKIKNEDLRRKLDDVTALSKDSNATEAQKRVATAHLESAQQDSKDAAANLVKAQAAVTSAEQAATKAEQDKLAALQESEGLLHKNDSPSQANWLDLFRGNEVGNYQLVEIGKVQMFLFTVVVIFAYGVALASLLSLHAVVMKPSGVDLPPFSDSLNALLGISQAAYLTNKAVDHTPTAQ